MNQYEKGFEDCKKQVKAAMVLAIEQAILMEREACAKLCEDINKTFGVGFIVVDHCAAAIRGRTE
jgi:hypothetical protein